MMARKTYTPVRQADGSFLIEGVEIFMLGESKGLDFNREWFDRAVANHNAFRDDKSYLPSVKIGHDGFADSEKPEIAVFDNLRLAADNATVVCDYLVEDPDAFHVFNKFPHRSVEIYHGAAHFSRVAHLGGTEPYFKLPPLKVQLPELFANDEEPEIIVFDDGDDPVNFQIDTPEEPVNFQVDDGTEPAALTPAASAALDFAAQLRDSQTEVDRLRAELETFKQQARDRALAEELKFLKQRCDDLRTFGLAIPIIDHYAALRTALLHADNPLDCPVTFSDQNGDPVQAPFSTALDELERLLFHHLANHTLTAKLAPDPKPFAEAEPKLHAEPETADELALRQASEIRAHFAAKGQSSWTNEDFRQARVELGHI